MAVAQRLPNGMIITILSPREAVMLMDELLEPERFPWQATESQMVTMELKYQLKSAVEQEAVGSMAVATQQLMYQIESKRMEARQEQQEEDED